MVFNGYKIIDLTHPLSGTCPTWNGSCGFCLETKKDYDQMFRVQQIKMHAGIGTHIDAPSHRFQGKSSVAKIPLESLIAPICLIDVSEKAHGDYEISWEDLFFYEHRFGPIPPKSLVIGHTGWHRFWQTPDQYRNVDPSGQMHFPAFSEKAAAFLLSKDIAGIAIDTLSPDCLNQDYPVHQLLLGSGKYIIENIADCSQIPPQGAFAIALPLYAEEATEAPIRIIAWVPSDLS